MRATLVDKIAENWDNYAIAKTIDRHTFEEVVTEYYIGRAEIQLDLAEWRLRCKFTIIK